MAETVIFPLSEETGLQILAALRRIAYALESQQQGEVTLDAVVENDILKLTGNGASVIDDVLVLRGASVTDDVLVL